RVGGRRVLGDAGAGRAVGGRTLARRGVGPGAEVEDQRNALGAVLRRGLGADGVKAGGAARLRRVTGVLADGEAEALDVAVIGPGGGRALGGVRPRPALALPERPVAVPGGLRLARSRQDRQEQYGQERHERSADHGCCLFLRPLIRNPMPIPAIRHTPTYHQTPKPEPEPDSASEAAASAFSCSAAGPVAASRFTRSTPPKARGSAPVAWAARISWA